MSSQTIDISNGKGHLPVRLVELGPDAFLQTLLRKKLADIDEWQTEMQLKPMRIGRVQLYTSGLSEAERRVTAVEVVDSIDEAVARCVTRSGDSEVAIIPEGPYAVPFFAELAA